MPDLSYLLAIRPLLYGIVMWGVTIYAFRRGGWEERVATTSCVIASYLAALVVIADGHHFRRVEIWLLLVDAAYLAILIAIVARSPKFWPMWAAAISGVTLMPHFLPYMPLPTGALRSVYRNAEAIWGWPLWLFMALGVRAHAKRKTQAMA